MQVVVLLVVAPVGVGRRVPPEEPVELLVVGLALRSMVVARTVVRLVTVSREVVRLGRLQVGLVLGDALECTEADSALHVVPVDAAALLVASLGL